MLGYSEAEIALVLQPTMVRSGEFTVTLEDGTRIRFPWFRTGFAENASANTDREIARDADGVATRAETNKGGVRLHRGVFAEEVYALALKMDAKLAITGDAVSGDSMRGAEGGIGAGTVIEVGSRWTAKVGDKVDPASKVLDRAELVRGFGRGYLGSGACVGLGSDIHAGDVNTKAPEMAVLSNTYDPSAPSEGVSGKAVLRLPDGTIDPRGGIDYRATSTGDGVVVRNNVLCEGTGAAHFALALFLKEVGVVVSTGDRARIDEFFEGLLTTDFYKQYGLFVVGARLGEVAYTRFLQRYIKPRFVSGLLKTNLVLAAGIALPLIWEGHFEGKAFAISLTSLGLSSSAVRAGVSGLKWVVDLRKAQKTGALGRV